ncbi:MAG: pyruvate ferredoxin oxidoreductase subunit gamma [Methanosarcinales archaeon]|nr:MAG: pyruvate ferredoxin oxidoreductase subunit gamma [Methanosarcinales archaeon]
MKEIRIHGRGGQGSVTAAELLAIAAFEDGLYSQAFPAFGVERRGAPVMAFVRLSDTVIRLRSQVYDPDYVIVQDATLIETVDVAGGLKAEGIIIVNTEHKPEDLNLKTKAEVRTIDATGIALDIIGKPIMNTVMLGAFAGASGVVTAGSIKHAVQDRFPGKVGEKNADAVQGAYDLVVGA